MSELADKKCVPCEGGIDAIDKEKALVLLNKLSKGWKLSNDNKSSYWRKHLDIKDDAYLDYLIDWRKNMEIRLI